MVVQPVQPTRKKPSWAKRESGQSQTSSEPVAYSPVTPIREIQSPAVDLGPRVMVFMIGGATFSELRCMSDLEQKHSRQVLLGSTHTWTPDSFVESLKDLGKRNVQGSQFYGFHRPPDPRIRRRRGGDDVPPRPREEPPRPRVARDRSGSGSSSSRREAGSSRRETSGSRRDIPPRPERRSPPGSPPRRPSSNRSRQEPLPEEFDRLNVRGDSGQRGSEGSRDRSAGGNEKKRGWFSKS